jgi:hypothetical protein
MGRVTSTCFITHKAGRVAAFRFFTGQRFSPNALMSAFLPRLKLGVYDHVLAHIHV